MANQEVGYVGVFDTRTGQDVKWYAGGVRVFFLGGLVGVFQF